MGLSEGTAAGQYDACYEICYGGEVTPITASVGIRHRPVTPYVVDYVRTEWPDQHDYYSAFTFIHVANSKAFKSMTESSLGNDYNRAVVAKLAVNLVSKSAGLELSKIKVFFYNTADPETYFKDVHTPDECQISIIDTVAAKNVWKKAKDKIKYEQGLWTRLLTRPTEAFFIVGDMHLTNTWPFVRDDADNASAPQSTKKTKGSYRGKNTDLVVEWSRNHQAVVVSTPTNQNQDLVRIRPECFECLQVGHSKSACPVASNNTNARAQGESSR
ncbi:hypothetical protein MMC25_002217 [Agyrium rufum]|nr:hypothetical protein [Agyrium rufum]